MGYTHIRWDISEERRAEYAVSSKLSQRARRNADKLASISETVELSAVYDPNIAMKQQKRAKIRTLSLFSGGGGLDLGFDRAGFSHHSSYEILEFAGKTIIHNRPKWEVKSGSKGNVVSQDWHKLKDQVDFVHGGPPCQPFSVAGRRLGKSDERDMYPEFVRAVDEIRPKAFLAENVVGFMSDKFSTYREQLFSTLRESYLIEIFLLSSADFGVPQNRRRAVCIGVRKDTHKRFQPTQIKTSLEKLGVRAALGLEAIGVDGPAPTLRSTLTGPRQTTSIANSTASVKKWKEFGIWPHGISPDPTVAKAFPTKDGTYRMCVEECQLIQGFPLGWEFPGPVYQRLGMIGNSVCPPKAYALASAIRDQIFSS